MCVVWALYVCRRSLWTFLCSCCWRSAGRQKLTSSASSPTRTSGQIVIWSSIKLHQSHASFCESAVTEKEKRILSVCHNPHRVLGLSAILLCRQKGADHTGRKPREQGSDHIGAPMSFLNTTGLFAVRLHSDWWFCPSGTSTTTATTEKRTLTLQKVVTFLL